MATQPREERKHVAILERLNWDGFQFDNYDEGEREILGPQLEARGHRVECWWSSDQDEFGPLCRQVNLTHTKSGDKLWDSYG